MIATSSTTYDTELLKQQAHDHLWMAYQPPVPFELVGGPRVLVEAEGCWMTDSDGVRYLDGVGALEACVAGHCRQSLADVAYEQMKQLEFLDVFRYTSPPAVQLAAKLAAITPGDLSRVHYTPGGSEAVETAIKVVKQYQKLIGQTSRYKIITREGAYHGCTFGAMGVDGNYFGTRPHYYDPIPSFRLIARAPYRYDRANGGQVERNYGPEALADLEQLILAERPETIAGLIFDPLALATGVYPPPPDYMRGLRELLDRYGILLILDEVITGFARTGKMFAAEHWGIVPDVMTVSKGISSGYMPIGAAIVREAIADAFKGRPDGVLSHGQTYGGHPVACAVALANIELIENEKLVERVATNGVYFKERLQSLSGHRCFRELRGLGMVYGIEFATRYDASGRIEEIQQAGYPMRTICRDHGLITLTLHPGNVLFLAPPLVISREEIDHMIAILDSAFTEYEETQLA